MSALHMNSLQHRFSKKKFWSKETFSSLCNTVFFSFLFNQDSKKKKHVILFLFFPPSYNKDSFFLSIYNGIEVWNSNFKYYSGLCFFI